MIEKRDIIANKGEKTKKKAGGVPGSPGARILPFDYQGNKSVNLENWAAVEGAVRDLVCRLFSLEVNKACFCLAKGPIPQRWESVEEPNLEQLLMRLEEEQQR